MTDLCVGPANYAGQATAWASAAAAHLPIDSYSFAYRDRIFPFGPGPAFSFPADHRFPHPRVTNHVGRLRRLRHLSRTSHVMLDGFLPVGQKVGAAIDSDVHFLREQGCRVALISHGSDLRHPDHHRAWFPYSYFAHAEDSWNDVMRAQVERNQNTLEVFPDIPVFASTQDLLIQQPRAKWLPLVVDDSMFDIPVTPALCRERPVVLHVPSRRNPPIKGTAVIDPILRALHDRGRINYVSPEAVGHGEMLRLISQADVVVDQLLAGTYGLTAVESMALGRLVLAGVAEPVAALMPESPPVVSVTPDNFEEVLFSVLADKATHAEKAAESRSFARRWHDGRASSRVIGEWMTGPEGQTINP